MYSFRRKSKQTYRKRVASRKNKTRSKRKYLKFRKMRGGGKNVEAINYTKESLVNDINQVKKNLSYLSRFEDQQYIRPMANVLNRTSEFGFFTDNLCVFVDFDPYVTYNVKRMYLGKLTSTSDELKEYGVSVRDISFDCYMLYSTVDGESREFKRKFVFNSSPSSGVVIGFLPASDKDEVLNSL